MGKLVRKLGKVSIEMDKTKIIVAGATGWVGSSLVELLSREKDMSLVGAVALNDVGHNLGDVLNISGLNVSIAGSVQDALKVPADILVDFTSPDIVKSNVIAALDHGLHVVIGTSGLTDKDYADINSLAQQKKVGVIAAGNFALTAMLLARFATVAAKYIPEWEIIDYASADKPDAPSGTARELAYFLAQVRKPVIRHPIDQTRGNKEARGVQLNGIQVHSVRLPGYVLSTEVIFGANGERLTIRHDADNSPIAYRAGVMLALRKVRQHIGLKRGLEALIER